METVKLEHLTDRWYEEFTTRFPGQIVATGEVRVRLLQVLALLDGVKVQRFAIGATGQPLFRLRELAQAIGIRYQIALREALGSSLVSPHVEWAQFDSRSPAEPGLTIGGAVLLVAVIPPWRFGGRERRAEHRRRHRLVCDLIRLLPDDDPDAGAQINRLVRPLQRPAVH